MHWYSSYDCNEAPVTAAQCVWGWFDFQSSYCCSLRSEEVKHKYWSIRLINYRKLSNEWHSAAHKQIVKHKPSLTHSLWSLCVVAEKHSVSSALADIREKELQRAETRSAETRLSVFLSCFPFILFWDLWDVCSESLCKHNWRNNSDAVQVCCDSSTPRWFDDVQDLENLQRWKSSQIWALCCCNCCVFYDVISPEKFSLTKNLILTLSISS